MDWNANADCDMLGEAAAMVMDAAELAWMLGTWNDGQVIGLDAGGGRCAILRRTRAGMLQCVAIAPSAEWRHGEVRGEADTFAKPFPATWHTKRRMGNGRPVPADAQGWDCGWACGIMSDKSVILARVVEVRGGELHSVQTLEGGLTVEVAGHAARRWWPFHRWGEGAARLFEVQGGRSVHNYRLACMQAANLDKKARGEARKPGKSRKSQS